MRVDIYDTTLRDGAQGEGISFTVDDKLKIAAKLDYLGIQYIEGGWPGSNPKDMEFFHRLHEISLKTAKITAFSATRKPGVDVRPTTTSNSAGRGVKHATIFGKPGTSMLSSPGTSLRVPYDR